MSFYTASFSFVCFLSSRRRLSDLTLWSSRLCLSILTSVCLACIPTIDRPLPRSLQIVPTHLRRCTSCSSFFSLRRSTYQQLLRVNTLTTMAGNAPFNFVNPEWLTNNAGAVFDNTMVDAGAVQNEYDLIDLTPYEHDFVDLTPYDRPQSPPQSTYGPPPAQNRDPTLAPAPSSPTRNHLNPTTRPFPPNQSLFGLRVETTIEQEQATPALKTPHTPRIELSPAEDRGDLVSEAVMQALRPLSRARRPSSSGHRPTGVQRPRSSSGRKTPMAPPPTGPPMSRIASAPGRYARTQINQSSVPYTPQTHSQLPENPLLAPVQPMSPTTWLSQTHNTGFDSQLRGPHLLAGAAPPRGPRSAPPRSRPPKESSGKITCDYPDCPHAVKGGTFDKESDLRKHWKVHLPMSERPHGCTEPGCEWRFWDRKDLKRHEKTVHKREKSLCKLCSAELCRDDDLKRHMETVHPTHADGPRNWAAPSPSVSSMTSYAMTPRSERSFAIPSTPPTGPSSFASGSRPRVQHLTSFDSIPEDDDDLAWSVPMTKSLTK